MATSLSKRSSGDPPDREPSSEPIDPTATTPRNDGAPAPTIGNQNLNTNIVYGSVHTINNKNTNYAVYGRPWNELVRLGRLIRLAAVLPIHRRMRFKRLLPLVGRVHSTLGG